MLIRLLHERAEGMPMPTRTAILRLYDYLAHQVTLDFTTVTAHILGCNGTLQHTLTWITTADSTHQDDWRVWLQAMCIDCDCAMLLQVNTMAAEHGALEGLNMRRCTSCNALLALFHVGRAAPTDDADLLAWATEAQVPAYVVILSAQAAPHGAAVTKVYPPGATFTLTDRQFFGSVLRQLDVQHHCCHP
jgi:hypothetical protein